MITTKTLNHSSNNNITRSHWRRRSCLPSSASALLQRMNKENNDIISTLLWSLSWLLLYVNMIAPHLHISVYHY